MRQIFGRSPVREFFQMWVRLHLLFWVLSTTAFGEPLGIDTKGLVKLRNSVFKAIESGACDKNKVIFLCLCNRSDLSAAKELASYGAEKFQAGLSALDVQQAVVKKYIQDHVYYDFDLNNAPSKGAADAKITVVEFADFQCGHCARLSESIAVLKTEFGDHVRFVFKQFPMTRHFPRYAAELFSSSQPRRFLLTSFDLLFKHQFELSEEKIDGFATGEIRP